jgi:hypothetical protein
MSERPATELVEVAARLEGVAVRLEAYAGTLVDHETRIRTLEKWWRSPTFATAAGSIVGALTTAVGGTGFIAAVAAFTR